MADQPISLDTDEAALAVQQWREYADQIEQHGAADPAPIMQLRQALGDTYADFVDAKATEQDARVSAYQRVAAQSRRHAEHLERTRAGFEQQDGANADSLNDIAVD